MGEAKSRYATRQDLAHFYADVPLKNVARALEVDGELVGVGGVAFLPNGEVHAFMTLDPIARKHKIALYKATLAAIQDVKAIGVKRVYATAQDGIDAACRWIERFGFDKVDGRYVKEL